MSGQNAIDTEEIKEKMNEIKTPEMVNSVQSQVVPKPNDRPTKKNGILSGISKHIGDNWHISSQKMKWTRMFETFGQSLLSIKALVMVSIPAAQVFGVATVGTSSAVATGGASIIGIIIIMVIIAKIQKKIEGVTALNTLLNFMNLLLAQLLVTNAAILELSSLLNIKLNEYLMKDINIRLNRVTSLVITLFPTVREWDSSKTEKTGLSGSLTKAYKFTKNVVQSAKNQAGKVIHYTNKFFNQDRLTNEIVKDLNMINSLFIGLYTQMEFQLKTVQLVCDGNPLTDSLKTKYGDNFCEFKSSNLKKNTDKYKTNDSFEFNDKGRAISLKPKPSSTIQNAIPIKQDDTIKQTGGAETEKFNSYRDAYLYWVENSENYKKLEKGNMQDIVDDIQKDSSQIPNAEVNELIGPATTVTELSNCPDINGDGICDNTNNHVGGGTLFFFDDIRKMLLKNRDAINSFLTNRNARKTRKANRAKKTRNGRKARKHTTIYKRKAKKHTNTNTRKYM